MITNKKEGWHCFISMTEKVSRLRDGPRKLCDMSWKRSRLQCNSKQNFLLKEAQ